MIFPKTANSVEFSLLNLFLDKIRNVQISYMITLDVLSRGNDN